MKPSSTGSVDIVVYVDHEADRTTLRRRLDEYAISSEILIG